MLLSPALGRIHQVLHAPALQGGAAQIAASAALEAPAAADPDASEHGLLALFAGHNHSDCLLLDQLSAWAGPPAAGPLLPPALPQEPAARLRPRPVAAGSAAAFEARAPPAAAGLSLPG
ncbi:hypothetical protein D3C79_947860 [compost metagenome]